jgi:hypothetical protein
MSARENGSKIGGLEAELYAKAGLYLRKPHKRMKSKAFHKAVRKARRMPCKLVRWHD